MTIHNQKTENVAKLLALKAEFNEELASKTRQINEFLAAKNESLEALKGLKNEHAEVADGAVVSEALHKARDDLELKLGLQEDAKATAELNLQRKKSEKKLKEAELEEAKEIWRVWYWEIWSSRQNNLRNVIQSLTKDIAAEGVRIRYSANIIKRLSTT